MPKYDNGARAPEVVVDPRPKFEISPYLFMQFMEPLGTTDSSVEAAWDFVGNCWREDVIDVSRELAPPLIRWGGCISSYYRWKEAVGPRPKRKPMLNLLWGGVESNQIGTHEFIDFCRQTGADPLLTVNFESDGRKNWAKPAKGILRSAGPDEAAQWVSYCNAPKNKMRIKNGARKPFGVRLWQVGNETSYDPNGFSCETSAKRTVAFARAMRKADPDIELIGWGDSGWARRVLEVAGKELQYIAFHHHFNSGLENSPLKDMDYREDFSLTWKHFMNAYKSTGEKIRQMREEIAGYDVKLAMTESHFSVPGRNRCEALSTWAAGVADARILNTQIRNGDILKIATLADFVGTRWMNNAIIVPTPYRKESRAFMMPVAMVMSLYRKHIGKHYLDVAGMPDSLDVTASITGDCVYLHVVNTDRTNPVKVELSVAGRKIVSGRIHELSADPEFEVMEGNASTITPTVHALSKNGTWEFPAASVSAVELDTE